MSACLSLATICSALCRFFIKESFPAYSRVDSLTISGSGFQEGVKKIIKAFFTHLVLCKPASKKPSGFSL